ncbi:hypothetical protein NIES4071_91740 [Calothrix sp. NIES-4071]|nr:hypothetical protein NIES4071_91740 [Calothrix sp. NIES-4071]BAZ63441.1 hypothetical protein NIES4105_91670 [Calothrix sp. NIES-4105]
MQNLILYALCIGFIISLTAGFTNNLSYSQVSSSGSSSSDTSSTQTFTSNTSEQSNSSSIQRSSLNLSATNLKQPQILKINASHARLQGEISVNGKVVQRLNDNTTELNLSPYLSVGQQKVEISARYSPSTAAVSVEVQGSGNNISQQTSGTGTVNYTLDLSVQ